MTTDRRHLLITMLEGQLAASIHDTEDELRTEIDNFESTFRDHVANGDATWTTQEITIHPRSRPTRA